MLHLVIKQADNSYTVVTNKRLSLSSKSLQVTANLGSAMGYSDSKRGTLETLCNAYNAGRNDGKQMYIVACDTLELEEILSEEA